MTEKQAKISPGTVRALSALLGGAGTSLGMDTMMHPDQEFLGGDWDKSRIANFTLNALLGAGGAAAISKGKLHEGGALIGLAPAKDLMLSLQSTVNKGNAVLDATATKLKNPPTATTDSTAKLNDTLKWVGGGALGLGGLALLTKMLKSDKPSTSSISTKGTLKYKILGRKDDPNDDIEVELPVDTDKFTPDMHMQMDSYIKRQAKKAIRNNARKRDPETGKLISYEQYVKKYGHMKQASIDAGLTNKPVPSYDKHEEETPSTVQEFYRLRAGAGFNEHGATVKSASRAFHEGAGTVLTGVTGAGLGVLAGKELAKDNPLLGMLAGGAIGGLAPILTGKALAAAQEKDRTEEDQKEHDDKNAGLEYLIPGYGAYNHSRRKNVKVTGNSFASTGMSPIQESYGTTIDDAIIADEEEDDFDKEASPYYDIIEKYAAQQAPAPAPAGPKAGVGSGPAATPVKAPASTAVTNPKLGNMQSVQTTMRDLTSRLQNTKLAQ